MGRRGLKVPFPTRQIEDTAILILSTLPECISSGRAKQKSGKSLDSGSLTVLTLRFTHRAIVAKVAFGPQFSYHTDLTR